MCQDDDQDCQMWIKCDDDSADCMANIQPSGWSDDGHSNTNDDKGDAPLQYDDDAWQTDGWSSNNLDQGSSYASTEVQNGKSTPVWPFLVAALVAGVIGAMFVVLRRKRGLDQEEHPLDGAVKKRQRLFAGMSKKKGALVEDFDNEEETRPNFIEISERKESYKSPQCDDSI